MSADRKIAVLGAGAIGGIIGGYLCRAGHDVTLIDQWPLNVETVRADGLTVTSVEEEFTVQPRTLHLGEVSGAGLQFDIVFLAVKSFDTEWSAKLIEPYLAPGAFVVSAQNSINEERIAGILGWTRVVGLVITMGAAMEEAGRPRRTSPVTRPAYAVGEPSGLVTPRLLDLKETLSVIGTTKTTTNLWGERWAKLGVNCMANSVAGFTGLLSAELRLEPEVRRLTIRIAAEVVRVADALGVAVEPINGVPARLFTEAMSDGEAMEEVESGLLAGVPQIGGGRPSLAQDIAKGRRIEIDFLNGHVVQKGREVGVPTPLNEAVVALTRRVAAGEIAASVDNVGLVEARL